MIYKEFLEKLKVNTDELFKVGKSCYKELDDDKQLTNTISNTLTTAVMNLNRCLKNLKSLNLSENVNNIITRILEQELNVLTRKNMHQEFVIKKVMISLKKLVEELDEFYILNDEIDIEDFSESTGVEEKVKPIKTTEKKTNKKTKEVEEDELIINN